MQQQVFHVVAQYRARPGEGERVAALLLELAAASRTEEGNLSYDVARSLEDSHHFIIVENYVSESGFAAHRDSEHFQEIGVGRIIPALESRDVSTFTGSDPVRS